MAKRIINIPHGTETAADFMLLVGSARITAVSVEHSGEVRPYTAHPYVVGIHFELPALLREDGGYFMYLDCVGTVEVEDEEGT